MIFFNILVAFGKLIHLWQQLSEYPLSCRVFVGHLIQTRRGYHYVHTNRQCDICFIRLSNDADSFTVSSMISLVLMALFLVFLLIFLVFLSRLCIMCIALKREAHMFT